MMKCPKCGANINKNDKFCMNCGMSIHKNQSYTMPKQDKGQDDRQNNRQTPTFDPFVEDAKRSVSDKRFKTTLSVSCAVAGIAAVLVFGSVFKRYNSQSGSSVSKEDGSSRSETQSIESEEWTLSDDVVEKMLDDQQECNLYKHFDVNYDTFMSSKEAELAAEGIDMTKNNTHVYMSDDGRYTVYRLAHDFDDDQYTKGIEIDLDTKSGRIHKVTVNASSEDECKMLFKITMTGLGFDEGEIERNWKKMITDHKDSYLSLSTYTLSMNDIGSRYYVSVEADKNDGTYTSDEKSDHAVDVKAYLDQAVQNEYDQMYEKTYEDFLLTEGQKLREQGVDLSSPEVTLSIYGEEGETYTGTIDYRAGKDISCGIEIDAASRYMRAFSMYGDDLDKETEILSCFFEGVGMDDDTVKSETKKVRRAANRLWSGKDKRVELDTCTVFVSRYDKTYYINVMK